MSFKFFGFLIDTVLTTVCDLENFHGFLRPDSMMIRFRGPLISLQPIDSLPERPNALEAFLWGPMIPLGLLILSGNIQKVRFLWQAQSD